MTTNNTPALEAAMNQTNLESAEPRSALVLDETNNAPTHDETGDLREEGLSSEAMTPLEKIADWSELERRLQQAENGEDPADAPADLDQSNAASGPVGENTEARQLPRNYRFRTEDPQRARFYQLMRQHPEANPAELARLVGYAESTPPLSSGEAAPTAQPQEADPLQPLRDEIAALAQQKRRHREAYEFDKADELGERLLEARLQLEHKTREVAETRGQQTRYDAAYTDARDEAARLHPAAAQPGSRQFRLVRMLVAAKEQESPEFFNDPAYPLRLLGELERDFPESFPRGAGGRARVAARPAAPSRLLGQTVAGHATSSQAIHPDHLEQQIDGLNAEQLFALAHAVGTRPDAD
jgi:hypothetical protein